MNITYNGLSTHEPILAFTDVPNILKVEENVSGRKCAIEITVYDNWNSIVTRDSQFMLMLFGETISNVMSPKNATNKRFFISADRFSTAASIARALRNCASIASDFTITIDADIVVLVAKQIGKKIYAGWSSSQSIPSEYLEIAYQDGNADESDAKFFNSRIDVDVTMNDEYVTTLEKNFHGNQCAFNVSPILATMVEPNNESQSVMPYQFNITKTAEDGTFSTLGTVSGLTTYGFVCNQSQRYLPVQTCLLSNSKINDRGGLLYTYFNNVQFSFLARASQSLGVTFNIRFLDSSMHEIGTDSMSVQTPYGDIYVKDVEYVIPDYFYSHASYVEITLMGETLRYNIIRPLKATEYAQRILWRNPYGGVSYFDFTGSRSESDEIDAETYEKNVFDYYDSSEFQRKKIYSHAVEKTVTINSHLIEKDGIYIFNELMRSKCVWTTINGKLHHIIVKNVDVVEDEQYNDIYRATVEYSYSELS